jgi:hypothetical protein
MNFITTQPLWIAAVILIIPTTLLAMAGPILVRRFFDFKQLRTNNEVAGFKFATVGVLYAVLLAFAVIVVWEKFNQAESEVAKEAGAAATVYRLIRGIDPEHAAAIRKATTDYLNSAIASDWPAMANGKQSRATTEALNEVYHAISNSTHSAATRGLFWLKSCGRSIASARPDANVLSCPTASCPQSFGWCSSAALS